jgi:hypothetical protein
MLAHKQSDVTHTQMVQKMLAHKQLDVTHTHIDGTEDAST